MAAPKRSSDLINSLPLYRCLITETKACDFSLRILHSGDEVGYSLVVLAVFMTIR